MSTAQRTAAAGGAAASDDPRVSALEALDELLTTLLRLVKADAGVLLVRERGADTLVAAVRSASLPPGALEERLAFHDPLASRLLAAEPLTVVDVDDDAALAGAVRDGGLGEARTLCGAPIRTLHGELLGGLILLFSAPPAFGASDIVMVGGSTRQAAEILERTRLHEEARLLAERERRHSSRLRMLADAALAMSLESDVEAMLKLVTEAACEIVGTHQGMTRRLGHGDAEASTYVWLSGKHHQWRDAPDGLAAPLVARDGSKLGLIQLADKVDGSGFGPEDEAMLVQLAQMASVSIENAELIQRERQARRAAEESARLRGVLSDAGAAFAASLDLQEVLSAVTSLMVPAFADWCGINLVRSDGEIQLVAESSSDETLRGALAALRERMRPSIDAPHGVGAVIRTGRSEYFPEVPETVLREMAASAGIEPELLLDLRLESGLVVPLPARGRTLGALTLVRSSVPEPYTHDELAFAEDLAARAALAIENATRYTLERQAADMLQRSLLPRALPRLPGLQAAARYLPGGAGTRIGGDWYDVIALDAHRMAFVVGDVMGRGIPAATVMGQLRSAVRAYALEDHGPARLLDLVDQLVDRMEDLQLTTCVYGVYDSRDATFTIASAGHPPPLLLRPDGTADFLEPPVNLPLGTGQFSSGPREQSVVALPEGSTLLLYTDGLIEARDCPVDEGMARLRQAAADGGDDPDELCDTLLAAMGRDGHHDDDTALLALSVTSRQPARRAPEPPAEHLLRADLRSPGEARRIVLDTAAAWGLDDADTLVLLTHELVTNAVLHGAEPVVLRLTRKDDAVRVEVADGNETAPSVRHYERDAFTGRGLALVEALAERWGWQLAGRGKVVWCEVRA